MKNKFMTVAAVSLLSVGAVDKAVADDTEGPIVKCYGIAKANKNDCAHARGAHGCAAQATINYDPCEWKAVAKSECLNGIKEDGKTIIGKLTPENCKGASDSEGEADTAAEKESGADTSEVNADAPSDVVQDNGSAAISTTVASPAENRSTASVDTSKIPVTDALASLVTETRADTLSDDSSADSNN